MNSMKMKKKYNKVLIFITGKVQNQVCISKVFCSWFYTVTVQAQQHCSSGPPSIFRGFPAYFLKYLLFLSWDKVVVCPRKNNSRNVPKLLHLVVQILQISKPLPTDIIEQATQTEIRFSSKYIAHLQIRLQLLPKYIYLKITH